MTCDRAPQPSFPLFIQTYKYLNTFHVFDEYKNII